MKKDIYENGATRNKIPYRFDLIPAAGLEKIAARFELGVRNHGENLWRKGGPEFLKSSLNHAIHHLLDYLENGNNEAIQGAGGNLGAVGWFIVVAAEFERRGLAWRGNRNITQKEKQNARSHIRRPANKTSK
jgi:hypothetical protein